MNYRDTAASRGRGPVGLCAAADDNGGPIRGARSAGRPMLVNPISRPLDPPSAFLPGDDRAGGGPLRARAGEIEPGAGAKRDVCSTTGCATTVPDPLRATGRWQHGHALQVATRLRAA